MTMVEIKDSDRQLSENDVVELEALVGCRLPTDYRAFLLRTNGGRPVPDSIDIEGAPFIATAVHSLHGIDTALEADDIRWHLDVLEGCLENKLLPIATDPFGHLFMLVLSDEHYGHVNYFDSAEVPPRPYLVSDTFDEFLGKLREPTSDEMAEIEEMAKVASTESEGIQLVDVSFTFTGSRPVDAGLANAAAEYETTPRGYVWHRHQDGETLQLVPKDVHKQTGDPAGVSLRWRSS